MSKPLIRVFLIERVTIRYLHLDQFGSLDIHFWSKGCSAQFQFRFAGMNISTGHRTMSGIKSSIVQQKRLHDGDSCLVVKLPTS